MLLACAAIAACGEGVAPIASVDGGSTSDAGTSSDAGSDVDAGSTPDAGSSVDGGSTSDAGTSSDGGSSAACDPTQVDAVLAAIQAYESAVGSSLTSGTEFDDGTYSSAQLDVKKTDWSNLPPGALNYSRPGITLSELNGAAEISAFNALVQTALSSAGYTDYQGVLAADDYLGYTKNANGYGADLYHVAFVGTPSETGLWTLMLGGHHMAFNLTFDQGCTYPTPHHIGVEPRTAFASNDHFASIHGTAVYASGTYTVIAAKANAMFAVFSGLSSSELQSAFLTGQTFNDILIGPVEANSGSYASVTAKFSAIASSSTRGVLVSSLSSSEQQLVTAAIGQYTGDYDSATAARLLGDYSSGYAGTYVAWANGAGSFSASGPDVTANGTYLRIDGPRVWIEIAVQNGIVIQGQTHFHMMFRDKSYDYFNELQ